MNKLLFIPKDFEVPQVLETDQLHLRMLKVLNLLLSKLEKTQAMLVL